MLRAFLASCAIAAAVAACSGESCETDLPAGYSCSDELEVTQQECGANAVDETRTPSVRREGGRVIVDNAMFRCEQEVCAYVALEGTSARVLFQPCDMDPEALVRCSCYAAYSVELPGGLATVDVYVRGDLKSGRDQPELVGSVDLTAPEPGLCDGSSSLRFAGTDAGGNLSGAPSIASEIGWSFLLIDGQCRYWSMLAPEGPMRSGVLGEQDAADFTSDLRLGRWSELPAPDPSGCPDASTTSLRYRGEQALPISCTTTELSEGYRSWLTRLYERGADLDGEVRYTLAESEGNWADLALAWPLPEDPAESAVASDETAVPLVVDGEQAAALRALRAEYLEGVQPGLGPWLRVPVEHGGAYYDLALRDVTPFEALGQLAPDQFFE